MIYFRPRGSAPRGPHSRTHNSAGFGGREKQEPTNEQSKQHLSFIEFTGRAAVVGVVGLSLIMFGASKFGEKTDPIDNKLAALNSTATDLRGDLDGVVKTFCNGIDETAVKLRRVERIGKKLSTQVDELRDLLGVTTTTLPVVESTTTTIEGPIAPTTTTTPITC